MRKDIDPFSDGPDERDATPDAGTADSGDDTANKNNGGNDGEKAKNDEKPDKPHPKRKIRNLTDGRKLAYSSTAAAISIVMTVLTCYLPITVAPLVMISLCYNIVMERCGLSYGIMTIVTSVGLGFLCSAANIAVLLMVAVVFVPYSLICAAIRKFDYSTIKTACLRIAVVSVFAALDVLFVFLLGALVADYADIASLISRIGNNFALGYIFVTLIAVLLFVCIDWLFVRLSKTIVKRLK